MKTAAFILCVFAVLLLKYVQDSAFIQDHNRIEEGNRKSSVKAKDFGKSLQTATQKVM